MILKFLAALILSLALTRPAHATILLSISPDVEATPPGGLPNAACDNGTLQCLIFSGTITPDASADFLLNSIDVTFAPAAPGLTNIAQFFFDNVPGFLGSFDSPYTGPIFALDIATNIAPGTYFGTITLLGGATETDFTPLASAPFQVVVVPEPATWALLALSLAFLAAKQRFHPAISRRARY